MDRFAGYKTVNWEVSSNADEATATMKLHSQPGGLMHRPAKLRDYVPSK